MLGLEDTEDHTYMFLFLRHLMDISLGYSVSFGYGKPARGPQYPKTLYGIKAGMAPP